MGQAPPKCPMCGTALQPEMEGCPNCPMSFHDAPPEKGAFQNDNFRNFGIPIMIFGGLAWAMWWFSQYMWRTAEEGTQTVTTAIKNTADTGSPTTPPTGRVNAVPAAEPPVDEEPPAEAEAPVVSVTPERRGRGKAAIEWKMRGVIYDLITLKPVPGVHMIFTDNVTNSKAQIKTDEEGRYRVMLPSLPERGYLVSLSKPGYGKAYLDPGTEGVQEMTLDRRAEIVKELSSLIADPASLQPNGDTPLITDFHMAPKAE